MEYNVYKFNNNSKIKNESVYNSCLLYTSGIDPTYLITGESSMKDFNLDYYVANSTKEQRNDFFDRVLAYLSKLIR